MKEIQVGMIGYKFMGKAHSHAYRDLPMFFPDAPAPVMKAICGRDEQGVQAAAKQFGWEHAVTDWRELVNRADIDVVDINAPSDAHKEIAIAAAKAGKHLFCEKPLALTLSDAREMLAAAEAAGVKHMAGFNYRFAPAIRLAKKLVDEGRIGKIYHFRATFLQDWIVDPAFPACLAAEEGSRGLRLARRSRRASDRSVPLSGRRDRRSGRHERDLR